MKRLLITGSSGFIGRNLKEAYIGRYELITPGRFELNLGDIAATREYLKRNEADVLIHCANSSDTNRHISESFLTENLRMFFTLESLKDYYGKMIYFGSGAEFGGLHYIPKMKEDYFGVHIPEADDVYGMAKYFIAKYAEKSQGVINLRLFGVFGKYEMWNRRFISNTICRVLKGMPVVIRQNKRFDYLWIKDLADIVEKFIDYEPKHNQYNVCTGICYDLLKIAQIVCDVLEKPQDIRVIEESGAEYSGCNQRLISEFDITFTEMKDSVIRLADYYKTHISEIDENML